MLWKRLARDYPGSKDADASTLFLSIVLRWTNRPEEARDLLKDFLDKRPDSPLAGGARKELAELASLSKDKGNSAFQQSDAAKRSHGRMPTQQRRNEHAESISIVETLRSLFRGLFGSCEWLRCRLPRGRRKHPHNGSTQPGIGRGFPATMGTDPNNKYSPEGGLLKLTVTLSVTANGYSFLPPTGSPQGDGSTIWQCSGGTTAGSTTQTWQGACATNSDSWSDVLFSGLLTVTSSGGGGGGPATPTTFNASVADISIYVDALGKTPR